MVEQLTLNQRVAGSSPARLTTHFKFFGKSLEIQPISGHKMKFAGNPAKRDLKY